MDFSKLSQNIILLPDMKQQVKVKSFHPWTKHKTMSEVLDLAFIEFSEGFHLSEKERLSIWDRIDPNKVRILPHEKFSTHSKSILFINHLRNSINFAMSFPKVSDNQNCATIVPLKNQKEKYDPEDLTLDKKEYLSGYTFATLEIISEKVCVEHLKFRNIKDDVKNILCSTTNPIQKTKQKVRHFKKKVCQKYVFDNYRLF